MTKLDWFIVIAVWMLIPIVLLMKNYLDAQSDKAAKELDKVISDWIDSQSIKK